MQQHIEIGSLLSGFVLFTLKTIEILFFGVKFMLFETFIKTSSTQLARQ